MASEELSFLHRHREAILRRWKEHIRQSVNPDFFGEQSLVTDDLLAALFGYILDALDQNHYHDLNRTFDTLVDRAYARYISISDVTGLLFGFIVASEATLEHEGAGLPQYEYLKRVMGRFHRDMRKVYSERVGRQASETIVAHRKHVLEKWRRDLPTDAVSTHFSVLSREEVRGFVSQTFDIANDMLLGTEGRSTEVLDEIGRPKTALRAYLDAQTDFFEPRGFAISCIERAIMHLQEIAEPILYDRLHEDASAYRKAMWVLQSAMKRLALAFSEHYNQRMMSNYYEEVSKMLHRIKNKITPAQTGLQTILPVEYEGRVQEGMLLSQEEADALLALEALAREAGPAQQALDAAISAIEGERPAGLAAALARLAEARRLVDRLAAWCETYGELAASATTKLAQAELVDEFVRDALEAAEISTALAKDLQEVQNELIRREPPVWEPIHINSLVRKAFEESQVDAKLKGLEYTLDMDADDAYVFGIGRQLVQPFAQVISNAIKYTPASPMANGVANGDPPPDFDPSRYRVSVSLRVEPDSVLFSCKDTGIGIPPGEEDLVFALCERCSNAKEHNRHGSGTGLYQDRKIVEQHNGRIWLESPGLDQGSTFHIRLPRYLAEEQREAAA